MPDINIRKVAFISEFQPKINNVSKSSASSQASPGQPQTAQKKKGDPLSSLISTGLSFLTGVPNSLCRNTIKKSINKSGNPFSIGSLLRKGIRINQPGFQMEAKEIKNYPSISTRAFLGKAKGSSSLKDTKAILIVKPQIKVINEALSNSQKPANTPIKSTGISKVPVSPVYIAPQTVTDYTPPPPDAPTMTTPQGDIIQVPPELIETMVELPERFTREETQEALTESGNIYPRMAGKRRKKLSGHESAKRKLWNKQTSPFLGLSLSKKMQGNAYENQIKMTYKAIRPDQSKNRELLPKGSGKTVYEFQRGLLF